MRGRECQREGGHGRAVRRLTLRAVLAPLALLVAGCFDFSSVPAAVDASAPPDTAVAVVDAASMAAVVDAASMVDLAAPPVDLAMGNCSADGPHACGQPCARGNALGVGAYCTMSSDCGGPANICQPLPLGLMNFCTKVCVPDGGVDECGANALCVDYMGFNGCYPLSC